MNVTSLCTDEVIGAECREHCCDRPTWRTVAAAIDQLDGDRYTIVILETEHGTSLTIGGGNNGRYVAYVSEQSEPTFRSVVNRNSDQNEEVELVIGGQSGAFPANQCINHQSVIAAAKDFYDRGKLTTTTTT